MSDDLARRSPISSGIPAKIPTKARTLVLSAAAVLTVCALFAPLAGSALAAPAPSAADAVKEPSDFAGVYLDRYVPAGPELEPTGETRRKGTALANYYLALLKERAGDRPGAVSYYRKVIEQDPSSIELSGRAARLAAQGGDVETGLGILRDALERNPDNPACYLLLSSFHATYVDSDSDDPEAVRIAQDAYAKFPGDPRVIQHLVVTLLGFEKTDEAADVLEKALDRNEKDPLYWYRLGRVAQSVWRIPEASEGKPEKINGIYEKALDLAEDDYGLIESIADFFFASDQHPRAAEIYQELITATPDAVTPREKLGRIHALNGDFDQAILVFSELLEAHPDLPNTQKLLARIYEEQKKDIEKAVEHYENSLRLAMGEARDYLHTSYLVLSIPGRVSDAVDLLQRARFHFPDNGYILQLLAIAHYFNEDYAVAVKTFEETIDLAAAPEADFLNYEFYYRYGASHERLHHFEKAEELFRKAISLVPADDLLPAARIYNYLGYMWLEQDMKIEEAGELIIKANELKPDDGALVDSLGWYYFKIQEYEKALTALLRAEELLGEELLDAVVIDHIAQSYFHLGKYKEAIAYEERAVELDPEKEEYSKRLKYYRKTAAEKPAAKEAPPQKKAEPGKAAPKKKSDAPPQGDR